VTSTQALIERGGSRLFRIQEAPLIFRWALVGRLERELVEAFAGRCREAVEGESWGVIIELDALEGADPALRGLMSDPEFRALRHPRALSLVSQKGAARLMIRALAAPSRLIPGAPRVQAAATTEEALRQVRRALGQL
jgi:hypothetical protein